ncbi:taurine catabolism dioxygenase [Cylindrobasidium torrendii FP15055 ss-10]|uniref:Taurine catabolism dioxygenase n=1 Tax=Cylindrobasidium torrendii FP15055 ss-10 TaxID=1314674 RepID=A0A0D7BCZ3_9AGAR|nr:taurine catabolism dioxygenase [Cylindrobasidium torrendii FP15055 ss-10]
MVKATPTNAFLGSLSAYESFDLTPHIGTQFPSTATQLSQLIEDDQKIKDLSTLVSHRGVVFFKKQDLTIDQQRVLGRKLGKLSWDGHPETSDLHIHPISEDVPEVGGKDVSIISNKEGVPFAQKYRSGRASSGWHSDITFEPVPSDYAILKLHSLPDVGGDTLWASAYEAYDRLSPRFAAFLEGLTAVHNADFFNAYNKSQGRPLQLERGAPENVGENLTAVHPVIRTNPVTGFKGLFVNKSFTKRIVELSVEESDDLLEYLTRHVSENHDLQVRFHWEKDDIAIWDNRSTFHTATRDFDQRILRQGNRIVSLGEKPFFDPNSKSRREVLGISD